VRARLRGDDGERGSMAPAIAIMGAMFLVLAGLIIDSSRLLTARARAVAYAEEAARAGAQGVDPLSPKPVVLIPDVAQRRVAEYCSQVRTREPTLRSCDTLEIDVDGARVVVTTRIEIPTGLLGLINIQTLTTSGTGEAQAEFGVAGENTP
jgi:hypothetical protein